MRLLTSTDIPQAMRIKDAAGWNQTSDDWRNLLRVAPETCFGLDSDGTLAATTTAICYEDRLAWIGMVLTDPAHRRKGFARRLIEHTLQELTARKIHWIKLDATEMGAPLYRDLGFQDQGLVERWRADFNAGPPAAVEPWSAGFEDLDRTAFGANRTAILSALAPLGAAAIPGEGFAMARPGSTAAYFGPCVARSTDAARRLLCWFLNRHAGRPAYLDLMPQNHAMVHLAREFGFHPVRRLVRMVRPGVPNAPLLNHDDSLVCAIAGFEFG